MKPYTALFTLVLALSCPVFAAAQDSPSPGQPAAPAPPPPVDPGLAFTVTVVGTTPLDGADVPVDRVPTPVRTISAAELDRSGAADVSDALNRRMSGVYVNEVQGNPFQPDVNYRGYTASPLLGTPQGLSVYMDGVRLNQPFGEVVSWDLIPRIAIDSATLLPGSNPLFGLNTLGGALAMQTKDGRSHRGGTLLASYGSDVRRLAEFEYGGSAASGLHWYTAGGYFGEDGWRDDSPSDVRQLFGKVGWTTAATSLIVSLAHANNVLNGNGVQEYRMLERDRRSVYTKPDTTENVSTLVNASIRRVLAPRTTLQVNAYVRDIRTATLNGDLNEESLAEAVYQPGAAERAALTAAGYGAIPASGLDASNTPFPSLRCIANVLLNDEPSETCNGLINRGRVEQRNGGASAQVTRRDLLAERENVFTAGVAFDRSGVAFAQSTELGFLNPDRSVSGLNAFADGGVTGGEADGEPFDTRVDLDGHVTTWSAYATDTLPVGDRVHLSLAGRYNRTSVRNRDQLTPGGGPGSLDGNHVFSRFNPSVGATVALSSATSVYASYSEGSRAATSIELGCADPEEPCKLPNAMAGDPPLVQVVTRTIEGGIRGVHRDLRWSAGAFRAANHDDILFVMSEQSGFGYFRNFGQTRRQGLELDARRQVGRATLGVGYTFLLATFESRETVNGESNSSNDAAISGRPGLEGAIDIEPGDRMPFAPRHLLKAFADVRVTPRFGIDVDLVVAGGSVARGNENGSHEPDGTYYLGEGTIDGYAVVNLGARLALTASLDVIGQVNNLFDTRYATAAQLGSVGFTDAGAYVARPLPAIGGDFPLRHSTFVAPGAPARGWVGARFRF
jgi:outer membrane receptor protein involved in Fe transport